MIRKTRHFTSSPTPLLPAAQFALATADMRHLTPGFRALHARVIAQLQQFIGTRNDVVILSSSGTGAMEASVSNLTSPGERVLVLSAGRYGERWAALAKNFGCMVDLVSAPYGETFDLAEVKKALKIETRCIYMQAIEASTGTSHHVKAVADLIKEMDSEALLVVDGITALGTTHLDMDAWGIDVLIGASETVMVPAGLSYLAVSEKAWDRMEASYNPRYYFDLRKERKNAKSGDSAFTPPVALIAALGASLEAIAAQGDGDLVVGRTRLIANAQLIATMTRAACQAIGLKLFSASPSAAITAVLAPEGVDSAVFVTQLQSRFGAIVANGQAELEGRVFAIAHAGFSDFFDAMGLVAALEQVAITGIQLPGVQFGTALIAAQKVFAEAATEA